MTTPDVAHPGNFICPTCNGIGKVEKLGLFGFKIVRCPSCKGEGRL